MPEQEVKASQLDKAETSAPVGHALVPSGISRASIECHRRELSPIYETGSRPRKARVALSVRGTFGIEHRKYYANRPA